MVGGNTIVNNVEPGFAVDVEHGSTFRQDGGHDTFDGDVRVANTSNADFRDALISGGLSVFQNSNLRVRNSDVAVGTRSLAVLNRSATVAGNVNCLGSGTVGLNPPTGLTLVAGGVPVTTSAGGLGWAYRAAVFGSPTFVAGGRFVGCN